MHIWVCQWVGAWVGVETGGCGNKRDTHMHIYKRAWLGKFLRVQTGMDFSGGSRVAP